VWDFYERWRSESCSATESHAALPMTGGAEEVKFILVALEPLSVTLCDVGMKVTPAFVGVTVYVPLAKLGIV
jgi:hypothetical protein